MIYPATGEVIARLHAATPAIIEQALAAAERAQRDWAAMSGSVKAPIPIRMIGGALLRTLAI